MEPENREWKPPKRPNYWIWLSKGIKGFLKYFLRLRWVKAPITGYLISGLLFLIGTLLSSSRKEPWILTLTWPPAFLLFTYAW